MPGCANAKRAAAAKTLFVRTHNAGRSAFSTRGGTRSRGWNTRVTIASLAVIDLDDSLHHPGALTEERGEARDLDGLEDLGLSRCWAWALFIMASMHASLPVARATPR